MVNYFVIFLLCLNLSVFSKIEDKKVISTNSDIAYSKLTEEQRNQFDFLFQEAIRYKTMGDINQAVNVFKTCLQLFPQSGAVKFELASILFFSDDVNTALDLIRDAVNDNPNNIWYQQLLATIYEKKSMINESCAVYSTILKKYPNKENLYFIQASLYENTEQWLKAINVLDNYEKQFGSNEQIQLEKFKLYFQIQDLKNAEKTISDLIKQYPLKEEYVNLLVEFYIKNDKIKNPIKKIEQLMKAHPSNATLQFFLCDYYRYKENEPLFNKYLEEAFSNKELSSESKVQYLVKYIVANDTAYVSTESGRNFLKELVAMDPDNIAVRTLKSDFYTKDGDFESAIKELKFILAKDKYNYMVWEQLLLLYNEQMDLEAISSVANQMIAYFPDKPFPYLMASSKLIEEKSYPSAIALLNKGLACTDSTTLFISSKIYSRLGDIYYENNKKDTAYQFYDKSIDENPNDLYVLNNYAYFLSLDKSDLEKAEKLSAKTIDIDPENSTFLDTYAWILFEKKEYSQALFYIKMAIEKDKEKSATLYDHYGDILLANQKRDEAIKMWQKALLLRAENSKEISNKINTLITGNEMSD